MSTTAALSTSIPTGAISPGTLFRSMAFQAYPDGDVDYTFSNNIDLSYGSPDRRLTDNGYFCNQYGYIAYDDYGVQYSYGRIRRSRIIPAMHIYPTRMEML